LHQQTEIEAMAKISVIGAGTAGLIFAYALLRKGYDVTVYSDRTPDQWLSDSKPTGNAFLFGETIDVERELGSGGGLIDFKPTVKAAERMTIAGSFGSYGGAVDMRMRIHRWLSDLESRGGRLVIEAVTPERADTIARGCDLTVLSAGRSDLARLVPRDPGRSVYDAPQRHLAMAIVTGIAGWDERVDFTPVKFNIYGDAGEFFFVPFTHKTAGPSWSVLWEAKPGSLFDRFACAESGQELVEISRALIREHAPWEAEAIKDMRYVDGDEHAWVVGSVTPTVRKPFGSLPSGALIIPLGDCAIACDPLAGQGANNANRMARFVADAVAAKGGGPFDEPWMTAVAFTWWNLHARWAYAFTNLLLEPPGEAATAALAECSRNRVFADQKFFGSFPRPHNFFPWIEEAETAKQLIERQVRLAA
jgi:2-polyprenyl-6-methoxyphenol hydroxylase-like FAD-dependent oxidoreductase